ncbi:MAG: glycine cleavage system aminomethyltransferase GcvT [Bacteroidetes bacterium]|nr:glycine cleavage system aminomethyltransferase GcvT [Bacteroidota bacterium]MBU1579745.1 glycine cleavage system aminomethyltransferase GcvT [Bacteroidota bacterium]MBU2465248.1 glycine cleavage system aminomethyltransferase GcvT [Bacteroidota bacterium]MBU2556410.1 glycine cleavage system aminomethyltransferase GcvT [Bacteroidota bacterium]
MKQTALNRLHHEMGGKMVEFAGFEMPVQFEGINVEHETVRKGVGVFDVSHMGEFWAEGPEAFELVQRLTSNDVGALYNGKIQYSCFPNGEGGIVDDLLVYRFHAEKYLLVVNAANIDKDWNWVVQNNSRTASIRNASDSTSQLAIQGPIALEAMQSLTSTPITDMEYYTFKVLEFAGVKDVLLSTTGYTGSGGCEIYFDNADAEKIYTAVLKAGEAYGIKPIGLAARDTLRLEMGFCLYGNDINDSTSPIEAGLGWITKFTEGNDFIDRPLLEKQKAEGISRQLRAFEMIDKGIPRQHYEVVNENEEVIGEVTSGTMSPMLKKGIGMAYINKPYTKLGTPIFIRIRDKKLPAQIVKLPFYKA